MWPVVSVFGLKDGDRWLTVLALAQGGEFAFVLFNVAAGAAVLSPSMASALTLAVTLSMLVTPALFYVHARLIAPRYENEDEEREADTIDEQGLVIVAGMGRFGQIPQRMMRANGVPVVVLDHSSRQIETLSVFGIKGFYGDASRADLLEAAGIERAKVLVIAIDDHDKAVDLAARVRAAYPQVTIIARAYDRVHYYRLRAAGAHVVIRETFDAAVEAARAAMTALGFSAQRAQRMALSFRRHDLENLETLYEAYQREPDVAHNQDYISRSRAAQDTLAEVLARDAPPDGTDVKDL